MLNPSETLNIVTTGARLLVDVSDNVKTQELFEARKDTEEKYPNGCVEAKMTTTSNKEFIFRNQGIMWSKGSVLMTLVPTTELNTEIEFKKVVISSCALIKNAQVIWKNHTL